MPRFWLVLASLLALVGLTAQQQPLLAAANTTTSAIVAGASQVAPAAVAPVAKTEDVTATLSTSGEPNDTIKQSLGEATFPYDWPVLVSVYQEPRIDRWVIRYDYRSSPGCPDGRCFFVTNNSLGMGQPSNIRRFIGTQFNNWIVAWDDNGGYQERYELGDAYRRGTQGALPFTWGEHGFAAIVRLSDTRVAYDCEFSALSMGGTIDGGGVIDHYPGEQGGRLPCQFEWPKPIPPSTPTPVAQPTATATAQPAAPTGGCTAIEPPHMTPQNGVLWGAGQNFPNQLVEVHFWTNWWGADQTERFVLLEPNGRRPWFRGGGSLWAWPVGCEQAGRDAFARQDPSRVTTLQWLYDRGLIVY